MNNLHALHKNRLPQMVVSLLATASLSVGVAAVSTSSAWAQQEDEIEEVVVTGSRLVRRDLDAPSPVVILTDAAIRNAGNVTIEETLNEMPQLASDNTSSVNSGGDSGILTADLRGLDAVRTLVLVNGRRFAPADSRGLTDLSSIPDALVDRVEIMTGGASAVYGSDAIAGAINFRLKNDFEGLEFGYSLGETDKGDATTQKYDLTIGGNFDGGNGNAVLNVSYTDRGDIFFLDRDYSAISLFESGGTLVPGGSSNIPGTRLTLNGTQLAALNGLDFDPATACPGTIGGIRFGEQGVILPYCDPEDRFNFAPLNYLVRPLERVQISALGHYDINDNITAYSELFFMDNRNEWQQAPNAGGLQTSGAPRGDYLIPDYANNPVLFDATRQFLIDNPATFDPDGDGTAVIQGTGRRSVETGPRNNKYDRASYNTTVGLKGDFEAGSRIWTWDTFFQFQHAKTDQNTSGELSSLRLSLGSDVTVDPNAPGGVRCTNEFVGCVPVNFLGLNSVSPEAAAFISPSHGVTNVLQRQVYGGFISGDLFELPAGPLAVACFRVDRAQLPIVVQVQPGDVVTERPDFPAGMRFGRDQHREVCLAAGGRQGAGQVMRFALGAFDPHDQHVLGEPAFIACLPAGNSQRVALLAEQGVAAVTRANALDRQFFGKMHDEAPLGVQIAGRMQALDIGSLALDARQRGLAHTRHQLHVGNDIRTVGNLDAKTRVG